MAYEKQTWQTGEVITAEKLNHMEGGIGSCVMVVKETESEDEGATTYTLDKTWQEIHDAMAAGKVVMLTASSVGYANVRFVTEANALNSTTYRITVLGAAYNAMADEDMAHAESYAASSANGYPSFESSN